MPSSLVYKNSIVLPFVDGIHEVLTAFCRTSQHGVWDFDETQSSDQFNLNFIRGNWGKSLFGNRVPKKPTSGAPGRAYPETRSMLLQITIRPSPKELTVNVQHSVWLARPKEVVHGSQYKPKRDYWTEYVKEEVESLRKYLWKCYDLAELPALTEVHE